MLHCVTKEDEKIYANKCNKEATKQLSDKKELYCPYCKNHVIFKCGDVKTWHFAHESNCVTKYIENESEEHEKGKSILLEWLTSSYPSAYVEPEEYIPETRQIADVYVEHLEGELEGKKWAFEFQHSELSTKEWKERHDLYQQAGIQDFWVLDENEFLTFSSAKDIKEARKFNNLEKTIFEETGFVYFLNLVTEKLTIDVNFLKKNHPQKGRDRKIRQTPYTYHDPLDHSQHIRQIQVDMDESKTHGFLFYKGLETLIHKKFAEMLKKFEVRKQRELKRKLEEGIQEKKAFARKQFGTEKAKTACTYIDRNEEVIADDLRALSNQAFFGKNEELIDRLIVNLNTFKTLADSPDDRLRALRKISYEADLYQAPFLIDQGSKKLEVYMAERNEAKLELVMYAYNTYLDVFETLASRLPKRVDQRLTEINYHLSTHKTAPTALDYACQYEFCETTEEVDDYIQKVKEKLSI